MTNPDMVTVICRCGARYDQRLSDEVRWSDSLYDAALPKVCGVCGDGPIRIVPAGLEVTR